MCWKSLTSVQLKLWRRWVFVDLLPEVGGSFIQKPWWVLQLIFSYSCWTKKKEDEKWHFRYHTLLRSAVLRVAFGHLYESYWSQRDSNRKAWCLNKLLAYLWRSYTAFAKYCIYCASAPILHRESTDSLIHIRNHNDLDFHDNCMQCISFQQRQQWVCSQYTLLHYFSKEFMLLV